MGTQERRQRAFYTYFRCKDDIFLAFAEDDAVVLDRRVCDVLAHDLIETLLAGLPTAPGQRRESDLEFALPETSA